MKLLIANNLTYNIKVIENNLKLKKMYLQLFHCRFYNY